MSKIIMEGIASLLWSYLSLPLQSEGDRLTEQILLTTLQKIHMRLYCLEMIVTET